MRLVCISDTHGLHNQMEPIPEGDVLVVAGDITENGHIEQAKRFDDFLFRLPHEEIVVVAGNHDWCFETDWDGKIRYQLENATYLYDSDVVIDGVKFYGSPWQPEFNNWCFNLPRGKELVDKWNLIPEDTDVLVTHSAPYQILDTLEIGYEVGCEDLASRVKEVKPKVHVFGHLHHSYGMLNTKHTTFINAAICNEMYEPVNKPIIVEI